MAQSDPTEPPETTAATSSESGSSDGDSASVSDDACTRQACLEQIEALREQVKDLKVQMATQRTKLLAANDRLRKLAISDGLTGLYNHRYFQDQWRKQVAGARRYGDPLSLLIIDVDRFKRFNDQLGHPEGDSLLRGVAGLLLSSVREIDLVARYGGDEFVIVLPKSTKEDAVKLAERIVDLVERTLFQHREVQPGGKVTASIGVASFPDDGLEADEVINSADQSLYRAKRRGRNQVVVSTGHQKLPSREIPSEAPTDALRNWTEEEAKVEEDDDMAVGLDTLVHPATVPNLAPVQGGLVAEEVPAPEDSED